MGMADEVGDMTSGNQRSTKFTIAEIAAFCNSQGIELVDCGYYEHDPSWVRPEGRIVSWLFVSRKMGVSNGAK